MGTVIVAPQFRRAQYAIAPYGTRANHPQIIQPCFLAGTGTGMPGIFTLTAPSWFRLVK